MLIDGYITTVISISMISLVYEDSSNTVDNFIAIGVCRIYNYVDTYLRWLTLWGPGPQLLRPNGDHLVFVFRSSHHKPSGDFLEVLKADSIRLSQKIHRLGVAHVSSMGLVYGSKIRGCFLPSFAEDTAAEMQIMRGIMRSITHASSWVSAAFWQTTRIKEKITYAHLLGLQPVIVSMGINAICHNWERLHRFTQQEYEERYGVLDIWISIPMSADPSDPLDPEDRRVMCPTEMERHYRRVGFYTTTDFINHDEGHGESEGVGVSKTCIDTYRDGYDYLSEVRTTTRYVRMRGSKEKSSLEGNYLQYIVLTLHYPPCSCLYSTNGTIRRV